METASKGAVVLLSGGLDSTTLLHHVLHEYAPKPLYALSFLYGQRHARELQCARKQAGIALAHHVVIDMSCLKDVVGDASALVEGGPQVPDLTGLSSDLLDQPPTYVPNRNMILLSVAAAFAEAHGITDVYYGAQALDEYGYWDCTEEFLKKLNAVFRLNRRESVTIHAPFIRIKKAETLKLGLSLGVDYGSTWSCYRGDEKACGTCPTCVERLNAFRGIGVVDPLPYE